ncbi:Endonuclease-reverse transcriptase [Operophtera brumata]|uniref:Endonuclease-reverse transcriptase n=1 Tax=Operophtera brumata TaxID=104452 RepID=A0A0L7L978_OPEBR|nr:Endonuclease-reverse transcriptase [Operophtera brumata]
MRVAPGSCSEGLMMQVLPKKWKNLQNTNYSIAEDYPPKILEKRKTLYEQAKIEKENGNKVLIKYNKLILPPKS